MDYIFVSGTCRVTTLIYDGWGMITPIHSQRCFDAPNINFIGNFHTAKQHIQFIKFLKGDLELPEKIQKIKFQSPNISLKEGENTVEERIEIIKRFLPDCTIFLFEICSRKNWNCDLYGINKEITIEQALEDNGGKPTSIDSFNDIYNDIDTLCKLLPENSKVILQTHFRIDIIRGDETNKIESREIIYNAVKKYCEDNPRIKHFDPSFFLKDNLEYFADNEHFNPHKIKGVFKYFYERFILE